MGTKDTIIHNIEYQMTNDVSKKLAGAGLSNSGKFLAGALGGSSLNKNAMLATVLFGNNIGSSNFLNSEVKHALLNGSDNRLIPNLMQKWITNSVYRPTLKQRRIFEGTLFGMPDMYDLERETPNAVGLGFGILAQRIRRKQYEYFASEGMPPPRMNY
jgi:2',3'-cyclic-nucleotide 2'-phosphodiesterase (5'-nucleotidase family)